MMALAVSFLTVTASVVHEQILGQDAVLTFCRKFTISLGVFLISQFIYESISLSL